MRWLAAPAAVILGLAASFTARAADLPISAFFGTFAGGAVAENADSIYFRVTARDTDVVIHPADKGFSVTWTSVIRRGGDPGNPKVRRKSTTRRFIGSGKPGMYRAATSGDPLSGKEMCWARIRGQSLIVYQMVVGDDGAYQIQRYERTLNATGMQLVFTRLRDGERVRTVKGRLVKTAK